MKLHKVFMCQRLLLKFGDYCINLSLKDINFCFSVIHKRSCLAVQYRSLVHESKYLNKRGHVHKFENLKPVYIAYLPLAIKYNSSTSFVYFQPFNDFWAEKEKKRCRDNKTVPQKWMLL